MSDEDLECPICFNRLVQPRILQCGHTLCEECITHLIKGRTIQCPMDRKYLLVPQDGTKGFPLNYIILRQIDKCCKRCKKSAPDSECPHCGDRLCRRCIESHKQYKDSKVELEKLLDHIQNKETVLDDLEWEVKKQEDHMMSEIELMAKAMHCKVDARIAKIKENVGAHYKPLDTWCTDITNKLSKVENYYSDTVHRTAATLTDDLSECSTSEVRSQCLNETQQLDEAMETKPKVHHLALAYNLKDLDAVLDTFGDVQETEKILCDKQSTSNSYSSDCVVRPRRVRSRQREKNKETFVVKPRKPRVIGYRGSGAGEFWRPRDVGQCPVTGHVLVADSSNHRVQILDARLNHLRDILWDDTGQRLTQPWSVCGTLHGDIIVVTTGTRVLMYGSDGIFKQHLAGPWKFPSCATSCADYIYVTDCQAHCIRVYSDRGNFSHEIRNAEFLPSGPYHIAICKDQIITVSNNIIYYMTKGGEVISKLDNVVEHDILGLTVDNADNIYVASSNEPLSVIKGGVVVQRVGQCGDQSWQLCGPHGLAIAREKLIAANQRRDNLLVYELA